MWNDFFLKHALVLVPTPIGIDLPLHAKTQEVLCSIFSNYDKNRIKILVEEAKSSRNRWVQWGMPRQWMNDWELFNEHNQGDPKVINEIVSNMKRGITYFLLSDAGLPGLADPGQKLVKACWEHKLNLTATFFDNSTLLALVLSGFETAPHTFFGFLPREEASREAGWKEFLSGRSTSILMETPYRYKSLIQEWHNHVKSDPSLKSVKFFLGVNLNQLDEQTWCGNMDELWQKIPKDLKAPFILIKSQRQ
jgi:16S rRNA (cytidine1402-2'-O)-methyltransferase